MLVEIQPLTDYDYMNTGQIKDLTRYFKKFMRDGELVSVEITEEEADILETVNRCTVVTLPHKTLHID